MLAAGLLARNAVAKGLKTKPWVKTSLSPGSQAVAGYLANAGLQESLDALGFNLVGFGCGTCIGNSGPLPPDISSAINAGNTGVGRRIVGKSQLRRARQSGCTRKLPVVSAAGCCLCAGRIDPGRYDKEPLGHDHDGQPVFLRDIWPSNEEIERLVQTYVTGDLYRTRYANVFAGDANWQAVNIAADRTYKWNMASTYVQNPPYFEGISMKPEPVRDISMHAFFACSSTSLPRIIFLRLAPSRQRRRPVRICNRIKCGQPISISTEPAAGTMK